MGRFTGRLVVILLVCAFGTNSNAALTPYTDESSFLAALSGGTASTLDFEGQAAGTAIPNTSALGGVSFGYNDSIFDLEVSTGFDTTSPFNFLGTSVGPELQSGDDIDLSFGPSNAIGMHFILVAADLPSLFDDEIELSFGAGSIVLDLNINSIDLSAGTLFPDGGIAFFLGLIDNQNQFGGASITSTCCGFFVFNIDDITTGTLPDISPIPIPGAVWLFMSGLLGIFAAQRKVS